MSREFTEKKRRAHVDATIYLGKIGAPQPHFRDDSVGKLVSLTVATKINHQASPSATNYWTQEDFDAALAAVVRDEFDRLAAAALERMRLEFVQALASEEEELRTRLQHVAEAKLEIFGGAAPRDLTGRAHAGAAA